MATVTINFPDNETLDSFTGWFCDGGGEQYYMDMSEEQDENPINNLSYKWAGNDCFITCERVEE